MDFNVPEHIEEDRVVFDTKLTFVDFNMFKENYLISNEYNDTTLRRLSLVTLFPSTQQVITDSNENMDRKK